MDLSKLNDSYYGSPSILLDDNGKEWGRFQYDKRDIVSIHKLPQHLINAFIASEDWHFFSHSGISLRGMIRSCLINMYYGHIVQGASTITQQLVRLIFLDPEKTFIRKIKEQIYALSLEHHFTKEYILEAYLNNVYFGCGIYGVSAAAERFWSINVSTLSLAQSALLAAIIRSPGNYCPLLFPLSAQHVRNIVIKKMYRLNYITLKECESALQESINIQKNNNEQIAPHLKEAIRCELEITYGKSKLYRGGLLIKTTLNRFSQQQAQDVFKKNIRSLRVKIGADIDGALLSMKCSTGEIKAIVGGFDFNCSQFNRALHAKRQLGSAFKPIIYAAALEKGMSFMDTAIDEPCTILIGNNTWSPNNYTHTFEGEMTLARALSYSNNIVTIKTLLATGIDFVIEKTKKCCMQAELLPYPSLALGCLDDTVLSVAGMFNVFANDGIYVKPYYISWIKDSQGKKIFNHESFEQRVFNRCVANQVAHVLSFGVERRRKSVPDLLDSEAISKTGTTNENKTCWFAGSTPELTTIVYVGSDDNRPLGKNIFPVHTSYPIWIDFNKKLHIYKKKFIYDSSLNFVSIDSKTGLLCTDNGQLHKNEIFKLLV